MTSALVVSVHQCMDVRRLADGFACLQAHEWACAECHHERDKDTIEAQLMTVVGRRNKAYQLQDLRCSKCRQVGHLTPSTVISVTMPVDEAEAMSSSTAIQLQHTVVIGFLKPANGHPIMCPFWTADASSSAFPQSVRRGRHW